MKRGLFGEGWAGWSTATVVCCGVGLAAGTGTQGNTTATTDSRDNCITTAAQFVGSDFIRVRGFLDDCG